MAGGTIKNTVYRAQIVAFLFANLLVCWIVNVGGDVLAAGWSDLAAQAAKGLWPTLGLIAAGALNGQIGDTGKARIVFLRWTNPLPGTEAFSRHMYSDSRINVEKLSGKHSPLPTAPAEQNALWYKLYKTVAGNVAVWQVHRDYLLNRDLAALTLLLTVVVPAVSAYFFSTKAALILAAIYAIEFLIFRRAAAVYGRRFVTTVLALKST